MVIKNKDGSDYKLQGVNPLMTDQDHWEEGWEIHYVDGEEVTIKDPKRTSVDVPVIIGVGSISETEILYCLPLISHIEVDPLYGQTKKTTSWGEKFSFEAIRIDCTGLTAVFFAKLPQEKLGIGSVIFVFKERQWWKISGSEISGDGVNIYCMPSELKPSFV